MLLSSPDEYLYQLQASNKADAIRLWRKAIKDAWNHCCAYCGENKDQMTIDHVIPQALGGTDELTNVLCACHECNQDKGHTPWEEWYIQQYFFTEARKDIIFDWCRVKTEAPKKRYIRGKNGVPTRSIIES